jgi:HK97 family phage prohead protease
LDSVTRIVGKMVEASETSEGLEVAFEMATHQHALDVFSLIQSGMVTGLSIGYEAIKFEFEKEDNKPSWELTRHISELKLFEVSVVAWPMNDEARIDTATVKSLIDAAKVRDLTAEELRSLKEFGNHITALLAKSPLAPAVDESPPADTSSQGPATPEQIANAQYAISLLKLRTPLDRTRVHARRGDPNTQVQTS